MSSFAGDSGAVCVARIHRDVPVEPHKLVHHRNDEVVIVAPFQVCPANRPGEQRVSRKRLKTEYSPPKGVILSDLIANFAEMIMLEVILTFFCSHY